MAVFGQGSPAGWNIQHPPSAHGSTRGSVMAISRPDGRSQMSPHPPGVTERRAVRRGNSRLVALGRSVDETTILLSKLPLVAAFAFRQEDEGKARTGYSGGERAWTQSR